MFALLATALVAIAAPEERLFVDLDVGLPGRPATAVAISPDDDKVMLAGIEGLLFRSKDGGESWELVLRTSAQTVLPVEDELAIDDLAEEAAEEELDEDLVLEEASPEDFEASLDDVDLEAVVEDLEEDLQESLMAEREGGVDTSLPEGDLDVDTEARTTLPQELPGIRRIRFLSTGVVFVATHRGMYRSVDAGMTFLPLPLPRHPKIRDVRDFAVAPAVPTYIVIATAAGTMHSPDGGLSWDPIPGPAGRAPSLSVTIGPGTTPVVLVGTRYGMVRSEDGGATFALSLLPGAGSRQPVLGLAVDVPGNHVYAVTPRLLFTGGIGARVLTPVGAAWREGLLVVHTEPNRPHMLWAGGRRGVFVSSDGGKNGVELGTESMVRDVVDIAVGREAPELVLVASGAGAMGWLPMWKGFVGPSPRQLLMALIELEPTPAETATWALEHHKIDPAMTSRMRRRAQLSWLGPRLDVVARPLFPLWWAQAELRTGPTASTTLRGAAIAAEVFALARWDIDRMTFNPREVEVMREHRRQMVERERIWTRVLRAYEARRRLQADMLVKASRNTATLARKRLRLEELTSSLDAQTGGRFTLEARRRGAPGDGVSIPIKEASGPVHKH